MRFSSLIVILISLVSVFASAGTVSQVKGNKMIIQLEGESPAIGDEFFILNAAGKRIGLVSIKQVKGTKALAEISKGRANAGDTIQARGAAPQAQASESSETDSKPRTKKAKAKSSGMRGGVLLGFAMNTFTLTVQDKDTAALREDLTMKDNSYSLKGFFDYDLSEDFTLRFASGYETFYATGTTSTEICANRGSKTCEIGYDYLGLEGSAHWNFITGDTRAWLGIGYSFLVAMTKKNNIPNLTESTTNQMILGSLGVDIGLSGGSFIPLVVEYGMFPGSSNVSASAIYARAGYGFSF